MRHHQKYFSVENSGGVLAPNFVAVMNTSGDPDGLVKHGNERVLKARFNDARFFWNVDQKKKLADRVEDLKNVTFQAKLGSYYEKTMRVVALVKELGGDEMASARRCLSKCDLTTEMVKEFTDLQGVVGGLYAKAQGEPEVWRAIYDHYKPLSMEDDSRRRSRGRLSRWRISWTRCAECFRVGLIPSGSKDPFALAARGARRGEDPGGGGRLGLPFGEDGELGEFFAGPREILLPRGARLQVRRSECGAGGGVGDAGGCGRAAAEGAGAAADARISSRWRRASSGSRTF